MTTLFISDLHLSPDEPHLTALFLRFLQEKAVNAQALYILGDLFEYWIGDDIGLNLHCEACQALKHLSEQNVKIYFMCGNRDILIGRKFAQQSGCILLPDPTVINLYGCQTLLMHGDLLCTKDKLHQIYRRMVNNSFVKNMFAYLPGFLRQGIAKRLRHISQRRNKRMSMEIMDVTIEAVTRKIQLYQVQQLIHGHTHRPAIHPLDNNKKRIVLGAWHEKGSVLHCEQESGCQLIEFV